jgi:serine/threonine protein kinase
MEKMFSLNCKNTFASQTNDEEMTNSSRHNKKGRKHVISDDFSTGRNMQAYRSGDLPDPREASTQVPVKPSLKKSWSYQSRRLGCKSRRFQKELEKTTYRVYHERRHIEEDDDSELPGLAGDFERWVDEAIFGLELEDPESSVDHQENQSPMSTHQLEKELLRTRHWLASERSDKRALQNRLAQMQRTLEKVNKSHLQELTLKDAYRQRTRKLQEEVHECQNELSKERIKGNQMQRQLEIARLENQKCQEKMRNLMFNHIPSVCPRFKDIGPVDYEMIETTERVGTFELGKLLGEGHYGVVQMCTDITTNEQFAIKVLSKDRVNRFKDLQQVALEVHVLKRYPHPNIIRLEAVVHAPRSIYLITELCSMDIHQYHSEIGLSEDGAMNVILGILRPLEYLHAQGICHLDLKPENVLLTRSVDTENVTHEHVRLCDFGLVNMANQPDQSLGVFRKGYACGTPGFFAPEMILKHEFEGRKADMWSLGCIVLELTLGFVKEWLDSYELVNSDSAGFQLGLERCMIDISPENYPQHQELLDLIHQCLQIEPADRINSKDAVQHPWLGSIALFQKNHEDSSDVQPCSKSSRNPYADRDHMASDIAVMC